MEAKFGKTWKSLDKFENWVHSELIIVENLKTPTTYLRVSTEKRFSLWESFFPVEKLIIPEREHITLEILRQLTPWFLFVAAVDLGYKIFFYFSLRKLWIEWCLFRIGDAMEKKIRKFRSSFLSTNSYSGGLIYSMLRFSWIFSEFLGDFFKTEVLQISAKFWHFRNLIKYIFL